MTEIAHEIGTKEFPPSDNDIPRGLWGTLPLPQHLKYTFFFQLQKGILEYKGRNKMNVLRRPERVTNQ